MISNSIHAINEAKKVFLTQEGKIDIHVIRDGNVAAFKELEDVNSYQIKSFKITDNGIGLNDENLNYFVETDTDHKLEIGGKGVGRFVCLKAFNKLFIESTFSNQVNKKFIKL